MTTEEVLQIAREVLDERADAPSATRAERMAEWLVRTLERFPDSDEKWTSSYYTDAPRALASAILRAADRADAETLAAKQGSLGL